MSSKKEESSKDHAKRQVTLNKDIISCCGMAKVFKYVCNLCSPSSKSLSSLLQIHVQSSGLVNGMDMDNTGKHLVTTTNEGTIRFYDIMDAKLFSIPFIFYFAFVPLAPVDCARIEF